MKRVPALGMLWLVALLVLAGCGGRGRAVSTPTSHVGLPSPTARPAPTASPATPRSTALPPSPTARPTTTPSPEIPVEPSPTEPVSRVTGPVSPRCAPVTQSPATRAGIGDPLFPQLGNSGYDALHYTLDLSVDVRRGALSGVATITARATQDLTGLNLDLEGLNVDSVEVGGARARYSRAGRELAITLPEPLERGARFEVVVRYSGAPEPVKEAGAPVTTGWINFERGSYVVSEPAGAATWYPVNDHPCDKATYTFRVTVPKPYSVAANGVLRETKDNGRTRTYVWESRYPMASYLATVNVGRFVTQTRAGPGDVLIRNYFPAGLARTAPPVFAHTPEVLRFFNRTFGPYPFDAYGVVVIDEDLGFALETQTISLYGRNVVRARGFAEVATVHELAHQWFGDSVSLKRWGDIWLNEGFATYAEMLWVESRQGRSELDRRVRRVYPQLAEAARVLPPTASPPVEGLFNPNVYYRGALTLHALRVRVGDPTFFRILRTYYERYRGGNAGTEDFVAVAEEVSGQDLRGFFEAWLYGRELPPIPEMGLGE